jgi:hypothetical protein
MPCDAGGYIQHAATEEDLMLNFKFNFQVVVEN